MNSRKIILLMPILLGFLLIVSCSDDPSSSTEQPPELPPVASMQVDISNFEMDSPNGALKVNERSNFGQAIARTAFFKAIIDFNLALPRALFEAASEAQADLNETGEWEWSYSNSLEGEQYGVRLTGKKESESIRWRMYITNSMITDGEGLIFEGSTNVDGTQGTWRYFNLFSADENEATTEIEWTVNGEDDVSLTLTVLNTGFQGNAGDAIDYTFDGTVKTIIYTDADEETTTEVKWNVETRAGYIISPDYNGGAQACWDSNFEDISCSEIDV